MGDDPLDEVVRNRLVQRELERVLRIAIGRKLLLDGIVGAVDRVEADVALPGREIHGVPTIDHERGHPILDLLVSCGQHLPDRFPDLLEDDLHVLGIRGDVLIDGRESGCHATSSGSERGTALCYEVLEPPRDSSARPGLRVSRHGGEGPQRPSVRVRGALGHRRERRAGAGRRLRAADRRRRLGGQTHEASDTETFFVDIPGFGLDELTNASVRILEVKAKHGKTSATMEVVGRLEQQGRLVGVADVRAPPRRARSSAPRAAAPRRSRSPSRATCSSSSESRCPLSGRFSRGTLPHRGVVVCLCSARDKVHP